MNTVAAVNLLVKNPQQQLENLSLEEVSTIQRMQSNAQAESAQDLQKFEYTLERSVLLTRMLENSLLGEAQDQRDLDRLRAIRTANKG